MTHIMILITAFGFLASCAQYQVPQANCFTFRAAVAPAVPVTPNCTFTPINGPEADIVV